jgi:catechol 2,3-dioxygenase-like lactoylglutathione lyase family enzyme
MTARLIGGGPEVGIVVRGDYEPMLRFYRDFLGFQVYREREFPGFALTWMRCGGGTVKLVRLTPGPEGAVVPGVWETTGYRYITFVVENVEEILSTVESAGGRVAYNRTVDEMTQAMLQDPEGNHVEFVRWHDGSS